MASSLATLPLLPKQSSPPWNPRPRRCALFWENTQMTRCVKNSPTRSGNAPPGSALESPPILILLYDTLQTAHHSGPCRGGLLVRQQFARSDRDAGLQVHPNGRENRNPRLSGALRRDHADECRWNERRLWPAVPLHHWKECRL